jgi:GT2 family glycosyltransferase
MNTNRLIAVVIINFNGYDLTSECLRSFENVQYEPYVLIVVDNASTDGSTERLKIEFPHVHYVESDYNKGFTGGNNLGLEKARKLGAEYVFYLNNDTVVSGNILLELSSFMQSHPEVGLAGPLTYYYDAKEVISFGGGSIHRNTGIYTHLNKDKTLSQLKDRVIYCNFIEGTALFLSTALADRVGGFSDEYFLTSEESELCVRIVDLGYNLAVITSCSVWHRVSQSLKGGSTLREYFIFRNKLLFVKRNAIGFGVKDLKVLIWIYGKCFASSVRRDRNLATAKGIILGVLDFFRGTTGPGRYAKYLNARNQGDSSAH